MNEEKDTVSEEDQALIRELLLKAAEHVAKEITAKTSVSFVKVRAGIQYHRSEGFFNYTSNPKVGGVEREEPKAASTDEHTAV
jgi:hypothetical protein